MIDKRGIKKLALRAAMGFGGLFVGGDMRRCFDRLCKGARSGLAFVGFLPAMLGVGWFDLREGGF